MSTQKNLITLCFAAVFTLGLAACGGGGGGDAPLTGMDGNGTVAPIPPNGPAPPTSEQLTAAAATKVTAIGTEAAQSDDGGIDAGVGGSGSVGTDGTTSTYTLTVARDRDGTKITIADTANPADADPANPQFAQAMDLGGGRTMHVRTMAENDDGEVVEEVVIVKTDIKAPKATPFAMVPGQRLNVSTNTMNDGLAGEGDDTFEALAIAAHADTLAAIVDADTLAAILPLIKSAAFAVGTGVTSKMFANAAPATTETPAVVAFETAGTYNGAMGTYRCDGDALCTVDFDEDGKINAIGEGWIFTPARGAKSDVADANYLQYGFWLMKTAKDGATTYNEVETFADAKGFGVTNAAAEFLGAVTGSATYDGGSVGVYVKNVLDDQADIVSATSGHFSADVELTANFDGDNVRANNKFTIGGTVTNFVLQHGEENDWGVKLGLADFSGRDGGMGPGKEGPGSEFTAAFNGETTGDSTALAGSWNGMFHGEASNIDPDDGTDTAAINTPPAAVTGEFNANFTDGTAAGGFGANKK